MRETTVAALQAKKTDTRCCIECGLVDVATAMYKETARGATGRYYLCDGCYWA